jgi:hypothetical protein
MPVSDGPAPDGPRHADVPVDTSFTRIYQFLRVLVRGINWLLFRTSVDGADQVPDSGPVIIAPVSRRSSPRRAARALETVDFPDPAGPSMAMTGRDRTVVRVTTRPGRSAGPGSGRSPGSWWPRCPNR